MPLALAALAWLAPTAAAQDLELDALRARWRAEIEWLDPDGTDQLLVGGLHYDLLDPFQQVPGMYVGMGGFSALAGDRGGFLVAGATVGWRAALDRDWTLDLGQFIGGGGGGPGGRERDGGLYLRPHIAFERRFGPTSLRLEVSHVSMPDGGIDSTQVALGFQGFDELITAGYSIEDLGMLPANAFAAGRMPLGGSIRHISPSSRSRRLDGSPLRRRILLSSLAVERGLGERWYVPMELSGAFAGDVAGYAHFLTGLGYRSPLFENLVDWRTQATLGGGGGGGVDTGGGLLASARTGLEARVGNDWRVHLMGGYLTAVDGHFGGPTISLGASWSPVPVELRSNFDRSRLAEEGVWAEDLRLDPWTVQVMAKYYDLRSSSTLANGDKVKDRTISLMGVGTEKNIAENVDLSLRAFSAYEGDVGGYQEGQLGLRYTIPLKQPIEAGDFYVQYHAGAAGGGDLDVGSGFIHAIAMGWRWNPIRALRIGVEVGRVDSKQGSFAADSFAVTLSWGVTRPLRPN
ncbi:hypothetical protein [Engelhardtia mirabilis]|uniref:Outer membrane protein transport protein (OMPP1/FadL/TodX) n=1 Tax=Engelhardtia mirabilis TaxID=2528011 RepID=A0A518BR10_9BACT|nr:hypothetical protein Pla133_45410 [Planctomycetes bacterium Pla133]QDV03747.1 hypothetical protein Pla86_45390 [Planctomycetes bacterium Pla86]